MMLLKALGIIDIIAGLILIFGIGGNISNNIVIVFGVVLLFKALLGMFKNFASWIDTITALIFFLSLITNLPSIILIIFGILIIQKGIISFL